MRKELFVSAFFLLFCCLWITPYAFAQDDLLAALEKKDSIPATDYTQSTFKAIRIINGHSVETRGKDVLEFLISHRFGTLNSGAYQFFGLDQAVIRLGLDYGVTDRFNIGVGRNSFGKTYDGFLKYKLLRQSTGAKNMPISLVLFSSLAIQTLKNTNPDDDMRFTDRMYFVNQIMLARKFSQRFSMQLSPTFIHRNRVATTSEENDIYALGVGARFKLTKRVSFNAEYYYQFLSDQPVGIYNSVAVGFDIETGGHVFQFHLTNSQGMIEKAFITETSGDFFQGDIHFGFNISRSFNLNKKKSAPKAY